MAGEVILATHVSGVAKNNSIFSIMKLRYLFLILIVVSLFSFAFVVQDSNSENKIETPTSNENLSIEKEPMQPFTMIDRNQFD